MRLINICALILCMAAIPAISHAQDEAQVKHQKITGRVSVFSIESARPTNMVVIDAGNELIIVDTELTPSKTKILKEAVENAFQGKPVAYLINTHDHPDHTDGNGVFTDALIVGHANCRSEMLKRKPLEKAYSKRFGEDITFVAPQITFTDQMELTAGDLSLELRYIGGLAHSSSDIVVFVPEEGVLITGDLIYENNLYFDSERIMVIDSWISCLESYVSRIDQIKHLITGHQNNVQVSLLQNHLAAIKAKKHELAGKESAFFAFRETYESKGLAAALKKMKRLKSDSRHYYFLYPEFDSYVYRMMLNDKLTDAEALFYTLVKLHPDNGTAWDSLGEIYLKLDKKEKAKEAFEKSLALDPENENAREKLKRVTGDPGSSPGQAL